jgi:hypothetical protein
MNMALVQQLLGFFALLGLLGLSWFLVLFACKINELLDVWAG